MLNRTVDGAVGRWCILACKTHPLNDPSVWTYLGRYMCVFPGRYCRIFGRGDPLGCIPLEFGHYFDDIGLTPG